MELQALGSQHKRGSSLLILMNDPIMWELPLYRGGNRYSQRLIEQSKVTASKWRFGSKFTWFPQLHTVSKYFLVCSINLSIYNCINLPMAGEQSFPPFPYSEILKVWMLLYGSLYRQEGKGMTGWDGWMASPTRWTWVWASSGSWWWTVRPGVLRARGSKRIGQDWATELNWTNRLFYTYCSCR